MRFTIVIKVFFSTLINFKKVTQAFFSEQKLFKQHGTIEAYLDTRRQQPRYYTDIGGF